MLVDPQLGSGRGSRLGVLLGRLHLRHLKVNPSAADLLLADNLDTGQSLSLIHI